MQKQIHKVLELEHLTPETFIIHFERKNFAFEPGQYVVLRDPKGGEGREYSIYSSSDEVRLSFLIREIEGRGFSYYLRNLKPGESLEIEGPRGFFILDDRNKKGHPALFVATGTGVSPFHSYIKSYPGLNYHLLHGVHFSDEAYGHDIFDPGRFCLCTSRAEGGNFFGRVSYYLRQNYIATDTICYLCGNSDMIDEVTTILEEKGIPPENIRTEVFF